MGTQCLSELAEPPTAAEVTGVIKKLKPRKAAGEDGIIGEALVWGGESLWKAIAELIQEIWKKEGVPEE